MARVNRFCGEVVGAMVAGLALAAVLVHLVL